MKDDRQETSYPAGELRHDPLPTYRPDHDENMLPAESGADQSLPVLRASGAQIGAFWAARSLRDAHPARTARCQVRGRALLVPGLGSSYYSRWD